MFTCFAQLFGMLFLLSLLHVMVRECRDCWEEEQEALPQRKHTHRFGGSVAQFLTNIALLWLPHH